MILTFFLSQKYKNKEMKILKEKRVKETEILGINIIIEVICVCNNFKNLLISTHDFHQDNGIVQRVILKIDCKMDLHALQF